MKFASIMFTAFLVSISSLPAQTNPELQRLKLSVDSVTQKQPFDYSAYVQITAKARDAVYRLIAADQLRTAADFYTASTLAGDPSGFYEYRRVEHELALVSLVLGHPDALKRVGLSWDGLNWSIGKGQRLGSYLRDGVATNMDPVPAPDVIRNLFKDAAVIRARAIAGTNNVELQRLRDEDQADREGTIDQAKMEKMRVNDPIRRARILEMVNAGSLVTGRDFHNAALVLQHGHSVDDFRLAHELSISAVVLGDTAATWLLSRTYDRMLLNLGHRQRLNTQYGGPQQTLLPLDSTAVNDRIRRALGSGPVRLRMN